MFSADEKLMEKWSPVLEHTDVPSIDDRYKKAVTARLLENQEVALREERVQQSFGQIDEAAPANATGSNIANFDPVLISLVRRAMPNLIAYDIAGVQPMSGPTGLIFAMKSKYSTQGGTEALFDEADTDFSGTGTHQADPSGLVGVTDADTDLTIADEADTVSTFGEGGATLNFAEKLGSGDSGDPSFAEMAFSIEKSTVTAKSRALKAEYTMELAQDLKAVHGLDAEGELANILSAEILAEINREVVRTVLTKAKIGALQSSTAVSGIFNVKTDSDGRWMAEKFKGLIMQLEREAKRSSGLPERRVRAS